MKNTQLLLINDMCGYGKVALSAMLPVLSHMGYRIHNLPTALVSDTLNYPKFYIHDTTEYVRQSLAIWEELGFEFDAISTGFIVTEEETRIISDFCHRRAQKGTKVFVDPIMGDNGKLYAGVPESTIGLMRHLLECADYAVPNYTEACLLADRPIAEEITPDEGRALVDAVRELGADVGFAFDGDADRLMAVDERGQLINGDQVMAMLALHLKEQGRLRQNTVVATVMSNMGLDIAMKKHGIKIEKTRVGDRYVLEKMLADGYVLGGEQSGHVILLDYNTTGDGLITAVQVISAMVQAQRPLSRLAGVMQMMPQSQYAANVDDKKKYDFDKNEKIKQKIVELELKYKDKGRLVVRASGTEPRVRVMIEGPDQREMDRDVYALSKLIEHELRG